ncbi:MAG: cell wall hydrolase [Lachnospiraceae bacterium]|nr:cell wall hydrolase [Lachnospiraceae bacterium]
MEQQELVRTIERRRRKVQAKRLYRKVLTRKIAPLVCMLLFAGLLAKSGVTYLTVDRQTETVSAGANTAGLRIEEAAVLSALDMADDEAAVLISGITWNGVSLGTAQEAEDSLTSGIAVARNVTATAEETETSTEAETETETEVPSNGAFPDVFLVTGISEASYVYIRSEADISADIVGKLYAGAGGTVLAYDSAWCYVQSGSVTGYVCTDYVLTGDALELELLLEGTLTVTPNGTGEVRVYAQLDTGSEQLGTLEDTATVTSVSVYYIGIEYNGETGYVLRSRVTENVPEYADAVSTEEEEESLSVSESISESESAEEASREAEEFDSVFTATEDMVYAIENVNIRASWSEDSKIIGYLFVGDDVTRTAVGNNGWDQVSYYGVTAYVCNEYISTTDPLEQTTTQQTTTEQATETTTQQTTTQQTTTQQTTTQQTTTQEQTTTSQSSTVTNVSATSLTDDEILMLAAMIYCEAGGESWDGKLAVGNVILNRLRAGYWGDTLEDVLSATGQFSPYASGRYAEVLAAGPSQSCIEAAKAAASGEMVVPSNYMFFCTASSYSYRYSDYMQIGNVIFYGK